jgi:hypothetical protein
MAVPLRTLQSADRPQIDELKVFISYSRRDALDFVGRLQPALAKHGVDAYVDREDIEKGEEWWERIKQLITEADTVIFVMTPGSANSEICHREVDFAERVKKRFLPIIAADITGQVAPAPVARLNYIFFIENRNAGASGNFEEAVAELIEALNTDIAWIREHTRIGALAHRWEKRERPDEMLLRRAELTGGETWLVSRPKNAPDPTSAHIAFITQSRRAATWRQRMTLGVSLAVTIIAVGLAVFAWMQRREAITQRQVALQRVDELCQSWRVTTEWIEANIPGGIYDMKSSLYGVYKFDDNCRP